MKVYVVGTRGFPNVQGGVEKHCEELYPKLSKLGCAVTVFARTPYISVDKRLKAWKGVKFIYLWSPKQKGAEAFIHTFLASLICIIKRPQIVHFHNIGPALFIPLVRLFGIKTILTYHSANYLHQKWGSIAKRILKLGERFGVKFADSIIVVSKTSGGLLEQEYKRKSISVIPNGVDVPGIVSGIETLKKQNLKPRKYIFTACRFVPEKGLYDLIEAYSQIKETEYKLVIAGDADHENDYSRKVKQMAETTEGVVLTGFISGKPLQELFANAGLFVLPSYYEGLPIALLEAMSYGLPVLVSDIPQHKEIEFLKQENFFKVGNVVDLKNKIEYWTRRVWSNDDVEKEKEFVMQNYDWDKIAEKTFKVYTTVLNKK